MKITLEEQTGTPLFKVASPELYWERATGAVRAPDKKSWYFPAYYPLLPFVVKDIKALSPDKEAARFVQEYAHTLPTFEQHLETVKNTVLPVKSYDHQLEGIAELLFNHRWALRWEMGTGKTKVVIDALRFLNKKALVACPPIAVDNWAGEVEKHGGGSFRVLTLPKSSKKTTIKALNDSDDYDIVVASFDTVKYLAHPQIVGKATKLLKDLHKKEEIVLPPAARKVIKQINNPALQCRFIEEYVRKGRRLKSIFEEIQELKLPEIQWLAQVPFDVFIIDESHRIKNYDSIRTKALVELAAGRSRRYLLSGSYVQGDPRDAYPQLRFLSPAFMPTPYYDYLKKHLVKSPANKRIVIGFKNLHVINRAIHRCSSERKLEDCVTLPARTFTIHRIPMSKDLKNAYNSLVRDRELTVDGHIIEPANGADRLAKLFQICSGFVYASRNTLLCDGCPPSQIESCIENGVYPGFEGCARSQEAGPPVRAHRFKTNPKGEALKDLLEDIVLLQKKKVIIWANYTQEIEDIEALLSGLKIPHVVVTGNTPNKKEKEKALQEGDAMVYVGQLKTGISVTLTAAAYAIFYSRSWVPEERDQPLGRNYRIGQTQKTVVIDLCIKGSVELQQLKAIGIREKISTLLTTKIDCMLCSRYTVCSENGTMPWTEKCILSPEHPRHKTFPGELA